jgi:hypothetical protein
VILLDPIIQILAPANSDRLCCVGCLSLQAMCRVA